MKSRRQRGQLELSTELTIACQTYADAVAARARAVHARDAAIKACEIADANRKRAIDECYRTDLEERSAAVALEMAGLAAANAVPR
jgi:hypothetical protein